VGRSKGGYYDNANSLGDHEQNEAWMKRKRPEKTGDRERERMREDWQRSVILILRRLYCVLWSLKQLGYYWNVRAKSLMHPRNGCTAG
jgi:hypothetical protein